MGMDAKACIFYGYSEDFQMDFEEVEDKIPLGVYFAMSMDRQYLRIEESNQRFHWDNSPEKLDFKRFKVNALGWTDDSITIEWNKKLQLACEAVGLEWDESKAGWYVTCDFR